MATIEELRRYGKPNIGKSFTDAVQQLGASLQGKSFQPQQEDTFERDLMVKQLEAEQARKQKLEDAEQAHQFKIAEEKAKGLSSSEMLNYLEMTSALKDPATPPEVKMQIQRFLDSRRTPDEVTPIPPQMIPQPQDMQPTVPPQIMPQPQENMQSTIPTQMQPPMQNNVGESVVAQNNMIKVPTGKIDKYGRPEYKYEQRPETPEEKINAKVSGELSTQKAKDVWKVEQDKVRAELSQDVMKNVWLDLLDQANRQSGWKPGVGLGLYATATGKMKWNDFYEAFEGTSNEYAARIARIAMPQTRAVRAIYLFKEGRPDPFSTIESGTNNLRRSYETIISGDMAANPESYIPGFTGTPEQLGQLKQMLDNFGDKYEEAMYRHTFERNPNLLKQDTINKYGLFDDSEWETIE